MFAITGDLQREQALRAGGNAAAATGTACGSNLRTWIRIDNHPSLAFLIATWQVIHLQPILYS
jgi:hypothetical protein